MPPSKRASERTVSQSRLRDQRRVVAIDGPAGSGKSTVAQQVAKRLDFDYIDTGAMYRALTWKVLRDGVSVTDAAAIVALAATTVLEQERAPHSPGVLMFVDGEDITAVIRLPDVTGAVSAVSSHPEVRQILVERQQYLADAAERGAVVEGRDVGTVVFPDAAVKIYLDAGPETRARRRLGDMQASGVEIALDDLEAAIVERDKLDSTRAASPLKVAPGAHVIDTSEMTIAEVVDAVADLARTAGLAKKEA